MMMLPKILTNRSKVMILVFIIKAFLLQFMHEDTQKL